MGDLPLELANPTTQPSEEKLEDGIGLCLSGGGYRAMLFHVGSLWRLHEAGLLGQAARISSVSGGSITSAALAMAWTDLQADGSQRKGVHDALRRQGARARRAYGRYRCGARRGVTAGLGRRPGDACLSSVYLRRCDAAGSARQAALYLQCDQRADRRVVAFLQAVCTGDYRVGLIMAPTLDLATAIAASSAFPPVLSPVTIDFAADQKWDGTGADIADPAFRAQAVLADGGVYDNVGLETVWKRYRTVLVSDAGANRAGRGPARRLGARIDADIQSPCRQSEFAHCASASSSTATGPPPVQS